MSTTKAASLAGELVRQFEQRIVCGDLAPGARFPTEKEVARDFSISRTVVREAFARLSARGLLESHRGSGAFVADGALYQAFQVTVKEAHALDDVLKLLEMRVPLEAEMADLAARRRTPADLVALRASLAAMEISSDVDTSVAADTAFHAAIARATGNDYYVRFTDFLGIRLVPSRHLYLQDANVATHRAYARGINRHHRAIYQAIETGAAEEARAAARHHMQASLSRYEGLKVRIHAP